MALAVSSLYLIGNYSSSNFDPRFAMDRAPVKVVITLGSILLDFFFFFNEQELRSLSSTFNILEDHITNFHLFRIEDESFERKGPEIVLRSTSILPNTLNIL